MARAVVSLGTATPGGGFPAYGQAFADTINEIETTLEVRPQNTKGSTENVPLLEAGKLDLGLVQGEVALEAFNGIGRPRAELRILSAMYATPGMFVVRVGDERFVDKANSRLHALIDRAHILVIASHNRSLVSSLCNRGILLEGGRVACDGPLETIFSAYSERQSA